MKTILVSACLLGVPCRYDGLSKPVESVMALKDKYHLVPVCGEIFGGLPTPRIPCEIKGNRVYNKNGEDKTAEYKSGAMAVLDICRLFGCDTAILKEKSPSCGSGKIYNGSFSGTLTEGDGITAELLKANGIRVLGESEISNI